VITWLAGKLSTPVLYGAIGVLIAILALAGGKAALLSHELGNTQQTLKQANADNVHLNTVITQVRAERDSLESAVTAQNAAIAQVVKRADAADARANQSAAAIEQRNASRQRVIPQDVTADEVNDEIRARLRELQGPRS